MSDAPTRIEPLGDAAFLLEFGDRIAPAINDRVHRAAAAIARAQLRGVGEIVPAYASVVVHVDVAACPDPSLVARELLDVVEHADDVVVAPAAAIEIPVCYGGDHGPDLDELAARAGMTAAQAIARHAGGDYRVAMLGFAPGFAYLLGLDPVLHAPRRANPRTRVPPGSVAIGGGQTGIYPRALPGGWNLIGRTPSRMFDLARSPPSLVRAGDRVRFRPIDADEFARREAAAPR